MSMRKLMGLSPEPPPSNPLREALSDRGMPSRASLLAGIAGTILIHLLGLFGMPASVFTHEPSDVEDPYQEFLIEVAEEEPEEPPETYTQTNPQVPDNEPDQTDRFAARNQQAANPDPVDELDPDDLPASESDDDIETNQFITGDPSLPEPTVPPEPEQEPLPETEPPQMSQPLQREIPLAGWEESIDPDEEGPAEAEFEERDEATTEASRFLDGEADEGEKEQELQESLAESSSQRRSEMEASPRPRPQLPRMASVPVRDSPRGVSRIGRVATDANFSEFGEYMERLIEAVSMRWNNLSRQAASGESMSMVQLRFRLTKHGEVEDLHLVDSTARVISVAQCRSAIDGGAPYGPWTEEMVQTLGDEEEITFTFHYR